jgi:flagellar motor switch protein FliN
MPAKPISEHYCRSLLHVEVPLVVTLGTKKMPIEQIVKLVPGVMIQFDKPCDSPMVLELRGQPLAEGEVVKIGDKFGLRINEILRPSERFIGIDRLR